jgi:threonine dehydratase
MTPIEHYPELAKALGISSIYFKREDLHKYGSHKGRSIPLMIKNYYEKGDRKFAISSSGNAALASALYATEINKNSSEPIKLDIFIGKNINPNKLDKLRKIESGNSDNIRIMIKERPLQALNQAIDEGYRSLRQSTDDTALLGYRELAEEISEIKNIGAIFIGTSSGTTAQALAEYFTKENPSVQVHIIQTSSCHPISDQFENYDGPEEKSIADAIVAQTTERLTNLVPLINTTGGYSWTATNDEIKSAKELVSKNTGLNISNNSALSIVGVMQAVYRDWQIEGSVVCLICGE